MFIVYSLHDCPLIAVAIISKIHIIVYAALMLTSKIVIANLLILKKQLFKHI